MLTARDAVDGRGTGLDAGADDYLVRPFSLKALLARRTGEGPYPCSPLRRERFSSERVLG